MKAYNRVMAGRQSVYAEQCFSEGFIGIDYGIHTDLSDRLPEWKHFNAEFRPVYLEMNLGKSKIAAGLPVDSSGHSAKGSRKATSSSPQTGVGAIGRGDCRSYYYVDGDVLPHRRRPLARPIV